MPHGDEKTIREKLADAGYTEGTVSVVPAGETEALYEYKVESHLELRKVFEIIDGVNEIKPAMLAEVDARPDVFDKAAKKHGFTSSSRTVRTNNYIDAIVRDARQISNAKADVIVSYITRVMKKHGHDAHEVPYLSEAAPSGGTTTVS